MRLLLARLAGGRAHADRRRPGRGPGSTGARPGLARDRASTSATTRRRSTARARRPRRRPRRARTTRPRASAGACTSSAASTPTATRGTTCTSSTPRDGVVGAGRAAVRDERRRRRRRRPARPRRDALRGDIRAGVAFEARPARSGWSATARRRPARGTRWPTSAPRSLSSAGREPQRLHRARVRARPLRLPARRRRAVHARRTTSTRRRCAGRAAQRARPRAGRARGRRHGRGRRPCSSSSAARRERPPFGDLALFNTTSREWNLAPPAASNGPSRRSRALRRSDRRDRGGLGARTLWLFGGLWRGRGRHAGVDGYGTKEVVNERLAEFVLDDTWAPTATRSSGRKCPAARRTRGATTARRSRATRTTRSPTSGGWMLAFGGLGDSPGFGDAPLDDAVFRLPGARGPAPPGARRASAA